MDRNTCESPSGDVGVPGHTIAEPGMAIVRARRCCEEILEAIRGISRDVEPWGSGFVGA